MGSNIDRDVSSVSSIENDRNVMVFSFCWASYCRTLFQVVYVRYSRASYCQIMSLPPWISNTTNHSHDLDVFFSSFLPIFPQFLIFSRFSVNIWVTLLLRLVPDLPVFHARAMCYDDSRKFISWCAWRVFLCRQLYQLWWWMGEETRNRGIVPRPTLRAILTDYEYVWFPPPQVLSTPAGRFRAKRTWGTF